MAHLFIGLGANLIPQGYSTVIAGLRGAIDQFAAAGLTPLKIAPFYESAPVPISDQPWYVNTVVEAETGLNPEEALGVLNQFEESFGRVRTVRNAPRVLDLDIIDYEGLIQHSAHLTLPHPRMDNRAFVLLPLRDIAPDWIHPVDGQSITALIDKLPADQDIRQSQ